MSRLFYSNIHGAFFLPLDLKGFSLKYLLFKSLTKFMLYGILFLILTFWPKISCKKMIIIFYHESIIHENIFFVFSFTSLREKMRINSRHPWQCCLTEHNYPACIRSDVEGQWGSVRGHHELTWVYILTRNPYFT